MPLMNVKERQEVKSANPPSPPIKAFLEFLQNDEPLLEEKEKIIHTVKNIGLYWTADDSEGQGSLFITDK
jgi:hypothetical protein